MAEIFDIVAQLSYNVEDGGLKEAIALLNEQLSAINVLTNRLNQLNQLKNKVAADDTTAINRVNGLILQQKKAVDDVTAAINNQLGGNQRLQDAIIKQIGLISNLASQYANLSHAKDTATDATEINSLQTALDGLQSKLISAFTSGIEGAENFTALAKTSISVIEDLANGEGVSSEHLIDFFGDLITTVVELGTAGEATEAVLVGMEAALPEIAIAIAAVTAVVALFSDGIDEAAEKEKKLNEEHERFIENVKNNHDAAAKSVDEQVSSLNVLLKVTMANGAASDAAFNKLKGQYPELLKNIRTAADLQKNPKVVEQIRQEIDAKEKANALTKDAAALRQREREAIANVHTAEEDLQKAQAQGSTLLIKKAQQNLVAAQNTVAFIRSAIPQVEALAGKYAAAAGDNFLPGSGSTKTDAPKKTPGTAATTDPYSAAVERAEKQRAQAGVSSELLQSLQKDNLDLNKQYIALYQNDLSEKRVISQEEKLKREEDYRKKQNDIKIQEDLATNELDQALVEQKIKLAELYKKAKDVADLKTQLNGLQVQHSDLELQKVQSKEVPPSLDAEPNPFATSQFPELKPVEVPEFDPEKEKKKQDELQKKKLADVKQYATETVKYTVQALQTVYDAQVKSLDKEIELRKGRVSQATELAKRGNTKELELEQNKLDEAQQKREAIAKKQMQLNALLQASNTAVALSEAIGAIVKAAAEGDPYTIALRVAAAVAALVAGIASLSVAFSKGSKGFSEGGYTGDGGKYEPKGIVHGREFVFDSEKTAMYRQQFEAIHSGIDPAVVFNPKYVPVLRMGGATRIELDGLERKLDHVIDAIEGNGVKVNQKLDAYGFSQSVETYKKWDRNRFK